MQPSPSSPSRAGPSSSHTSTPLPPSGKPDRLYVGNLAPTVDEYTLIQILGKYGKVTKLDFIFHKNGPLKGKPRGYAFVEYSDKDDALKAMIKLHNRLLRGRNLVVTPANSAPPTDMPSLHKGRRDPPKTTTLSLLKASKKPQSAAAQIAAMEAKLATMARHKPQDETYVPGQRITSGPSSPRMSNLETLSSPTMADGDGVDVEENLGSDAAAKAAEELEREMEVELAERDREKVEVSTKTAEGGSGRQISSESQRRGLASLPPKPILE
ncbi:hypothetical protein M231_06827 [Tremella mesenterica]|uniref:Probable RNA-binding protein 18 n=1 Tax=Tremella mesenterica TaxID=5217 RepID=A0A4Q1BCV2_TREME|nr:hypothetical protein M231_06827 [Tremella mesenterica]